jgi:hypothetical protein
MSQTPPEKIRNMDWRINNVTWTTAPLAIPGTSTVISASAAVSEAALITNGSERLWITVPNATALFLGLSHKHHEEAEYWVKKCIAKKNKANQLPEGESATFFERIIASVVFAYTSLEAFVNEEVPDDYIYEIVEKNCPRSLVKEQIERSLPLGYQAGKCFAESFECCISQG